MKTSPLAGISAILLMTASSVWAAEPAVKPEPLISMNLGDLSLTQAAETLRAQSGMTFPVLARNPQSGPDVSLSAIPLSRALKVIAAAYDVCLVMGPVYPSFRSCQPFANTEEPKRTLLGVQLRSDGAPNGAEVRHVLPDSVASRAGIQSGDRVVSFNGVPIADAAQLVAAVAELQAGARVTLEVFRDSRRQSLVAQF